MKLSMGVEHQLLPVTRTSLKESREQSPSCGLPPRSHFCAQNKWKGTTPRLKEEKRVPPQVCTWNLVWSLPLFSSTYAVVLEDLSFSML